MRTPRSTELIPWAIEPRHRWDYRLAMLRMEVRRRSGVQLNDDDDRRLDRFFDWYRRNDCVLAYDPGTEDGFSTVPRRPGVDHDWIREPDLPAAPDDLSSLEELIARELVARDLIARDDA